MNTRQAGVTVGLSAVLILAMAVWSVNVIGDSVPGGENMVPTMHFSAREQYYPTKVNFDGDWVIDSSEYMEYDKDTDPKALYYKRIDYDNFVVYAYMAYYVMNDGINWHKCDSEGMLVFAKYTEEGFEPFAMGLPAHGEWTFFDIDSRDDMHSYVSKGGHAQYGTKVEARISGLGEALTGKDYELIPHSEIEKHDDTIRYENTAFLAVGGGPSTGSMVWSSWMNLEDPAEYLENTELKEPMGEVSVVPLSATESLPTTTEIGFNMLWIIPIAVIFTFIFDEGAWVTLSIIAVAVVAIALFGSFYQLHEDILPEASACNTLRMVPYGLLTIVASSIAYFTEIGWEKGVKKALSKTTKTGLHAGAFALGMSTILTGTGVMWFVGLVSLGAGWEVIERL